MTSQLLAMSVRTAKLADFTKQREIAAGGEGKIYEHPSDKNKVVKIYHKARRPEFVKHLEKLSKLPVAFVTPKEIFVDAKGHVLGFDMEYVNFNNFWLFNNLFNKGFCTANNIDKRLKLIILNYLKKALEHIHDHDIVIGDLNQYNLFIGKQGDILFVDVDSYQTPDNAHSGVLLDEIRDWTTSDINKQTDSYAFDILSFWSTTYCHPYKWVIPGNKESLEMRVKAHKSILTKMPNIKIPPLYDPPVGDLLVQFSEIFNYGRRYMVNFTGVHVPVSAVVKQQVVSQSLTIRELYRNITKIYVTDTQFSVKMGDTWGLVEARYKGVTREITSIECNILFPADSGYAYVIKDTLYSQNPAVYNKVFANPIFQFNNGYLAVIEYDRDMQWNYNLNNQLGGMDNTNTPVFAKSIVKRQWLIQNFGSQKYLNVPYLNRYSMIPIPSGTKDGFYNKEYVCVEIKQKNRITFQLRYVKDANNHTMIEFDYLPNIAVGLGGTVLVPEDGFIDVYTNLQLLIRLDCSMCTRDSRLFHTQAGILLLEDNTLYLLNTK